MKERYKRTKFDSPLRCPYCGKQFTSSIERRLAYYRDRNPPHKTKCKSCGSWFYYINITAKYARDNNIQATWKVGEYGNAAVLR